jgi:hypothetical protein
MDEAEAESSFAEVAAEALLSDDSKSASSSTARILAVLIEQNYSSQSALLASRANFSEDRANSARR